MTYLEAVALIKSIEGKYDVMSIRYKGVSVWPHLRLYLLDGISRHSEIKASGSIMKVVIKSLFSFNPFQMFKRHKIWLFTACERRKRIGDKMIHRVSGGITASEDCLMIEKPGLEKNHYRRNEIEEKSIVSESWLLVLSHILEVLLKFRTPIIENEQVLKQILSDHQLTFDYRHYINALNAKRLSLLWTMKLTPKPQLAIMECPYTAMGYMWAFHQKGVKVLEMQHGVAGRNHNAYNGKAYDSVLNPDGLCVYGVEEYSYFTDEEPQYAPKVYMTGLYMLEKADAYFECDVFIAYRSKYDKVIVCSGQPGLEEQLASFVNAIAANNKNLLFVYIPRNNNTELRFTESNIEFVRNVNIYQYLKWTDFHITISSTTCLEAQYFHKPTIFYNYNNISSSYYGSILQEENGAAYISMPDDFSNALKHVQLETFKFIEVFAHNHLYNIKTAINDLIINNKQ